MACFSVNLHAAENVKKSKQLILQLKEKTFDKMDGITPIISWKI